MQVEKTVKYSGCNDIIGRNTEYLDRHVLECDNQEILQRARLAKFGCDGTINMQYEYTCARFVRNTMFLKILATLISVLF